MAVRLEFLTQNQQAINLAKRYWATNSEGVFLERIVDLLPFRDITKAHAVGKYVREICQAYDENQKCRVCDGLMRIRIRADAKKAPPRRSYETCEDCLRLLKKEREAKEADERAELETYLAPYVENKSEKTVAYMDFGDDTIIILQSINALIGPRLMQGTFSLSDCDQLTPLGAEDFIDRLYTRQILEDDPTVAPHGTYYVEDGRLWIKKSTAQYFLPPDTDRGREPGLIGDLLNWKFSDAEALTNLWLDYAVTDVMRYLGYQCSLHNQDLEQEDLKKSEDLVRQGLRRYSVAQLWFIMWKVTRDAAALSRRIYYGQEKAVATIPTKIRKQLELADQGTVLRNDWSRPGSHIAGAIGMVLNSHFGMDERSTGLEVLKMLSAYGNQNSNEVPSDQQLATLFMEATLECQCSLTALDVFAEHVKKGMSTKDAISETVRSMAQFDA